MNNRGFTLVELALSLVLIGLIIGGVLQGQELVHQTQMRKVISQIREYDTAVGTFRAKYDNYIPGDFRYAFKFGLSADMNVSYMPPNDMEDNNDGNGDGILQDNSGTRASQFGGEIANFWIHITEAGLIKGSYNQITSCEGVALGNECSGIAGDNFPSAPVGTGILAVSNMDKLYYISGTGNDLDSQDNFDGAGGPTSAVANTLTPGEAYSLDEKLDDGDALGGLVTAVSQYGNGGVAPYYVFTASSSDAAGCFTTSGSSNNYNLSLDSALCSLAIRASN